MTLVLIQFGLSLLAALLGAAAGWWLRGWPKKRIAATPATASPRREVAGQVLQSLAAAAETVRTCVEQHAECMRTIQSELSDSTSTEPAVISKLADSIVASNGLVQHQFADIRNQLNDKRQEVRDCLANTEGLLFTFASLDRQKHMYRQVLSSLEVLAAELSRDIRGHGKRLQQAAGDLEDSSNQTAAGIAQIATQILDATDNVQRTITVKEERIASQAAAVQMQAILTHTDLLTSLPNRRALEAELQRVANQSNGRSPLCTLLFVDLDAFAKVNADYGHQGGDLVLRQAAAMLKKLVRGRDMVTRFGGDTFAILLSQTTLHDALPIAERARKLLAEKQFSHGGRSQQVTASVGIAQLTPEEMRGAVMLRVEEALAAARNAGGNVCYRHDGQECFPVSSAFGQSQQQATEPTLSLASLWRDSTGDANKASGEGGGAMMGADHDPDLSGRSLFAANLTRRLAEWKRGGASVSVAVVSVDQLAELVDRFGEKGQEFLRQVMGRLLEATTRDMDERCEFEDGLFALILPGTDEANALAVADRLRAQIGQCKVRMDNDLWDLTASIGVAHCTVAARVMDIMLSAEAAMQSATERGGDAVCVGLPIQEPAAATTQ